MSDFDTVLERLLGDPGFKALLAADPQRALGGYHLAPDEVALLQAQVSDASGDDRTVEIRTSKASLFGLLSPLAGLGGGLADAGLGVAGSGTDGGRSGIGPAVSDVIGQPMPGPDQRLGAAETSGLGTDYDDDTGGLLSTNLSQFGTNLNDATQPENAGFGAAPASTEPPAGYRTRVDANGDGRWDEHLYVNRADGGVDIVVDANKDGVVDFIGHDLDRDGLIDEASVDNDRDGTLESRWVDVNGDGWLDKRK